MKTLQEKQATPTSLLPPPKYSLRPYKGEWTLKQAAHLLRRTTFGATYEELKVFASKGRQQAVKDILNVSSELPAPPLNYRYDRDPYVPIGASWLDQPYNEEANVTSYRLASLKAWNTGILINSESTIREKMTLFWHNHFVVQDSTVREGSYLYQYLTTLRENATGNFKELVEKITLDPAMLRYLNGNSNTRNRPNENYARELLELFTLGKGDLAGPGDYTTFTEDDVLAVAKVLTGWRDRGYKSRDPEEVRRVIFTQARHDRGRKELSHRFDNAIIENTDEDEYSQLIDLIFQKRDVALFICRKIYRWFLYYEINDSVEEQIINPLADTLIANEFEIEPVLQQLLSSEHFFDVDLIGPMIKNPIDFVIGLFRQFEIAIPADDYNKQYRVWNAINNLFPLLQMVYLDPPDVAGWKAYYQEPSFYQIWISSVTLTARMEITDQVSTQNRRVAGVPLKIDILRFIETLEDTLDPNSVIHEMASILFTQPLTDKQVITLKEILIPGLPDYEWTVEYSDYLADPDDADLKNGVENRLRSLLQAMLSMPEFYLM